MKPLLLFILLEFVRGHPEVQTSLPQDVPTASAIASSLSRAPLKSEQRAEVEAALKAREYAHIESLLVEEIEKNSKSPELLTLLGGVFFLDGKYLNCAVAMKKAEALAPLDNRNRFTLAMAYVVLKRSDWARKELETLEALEPSNALYPYWLARVAYDDMRYYDAIAGFQKSLQLDPESVRARDNLGLCYEALGKFAEAIESFRGAVHLNRSSVRGSPWPALNLGILLTKLGSLDGAEASLREALRYDAKLAQAHYHLGVLLEKRQQLQDAIEELNSAAMLNPSYPEPHYALGRIYRKMGEREKAERELAAFEKLKNRNKEVK